MATMAVEKKISEVLAAEFDKQLRDKQSELTAMDIKLSALRSAEHDLTLTCAELQEKLAQARQTWKTVENAQQFLGWCEKHLGLED